MAQQDLSLRSKTRPDPSAILAPLDSVFLPSQTMDAALVAFAVPELVHGSKISHYGGILSGTGGVGKTYFMEQLQKAYEIAGAYARKCVIADVSDRFVGTRARDLAKILRKAAQRGKQKRIPSLVWFDEATSLVLSAQANGSDWELGGLDTLKSYVGNEPYLVFGVTTNEVNTDRFEPQLTRPGRLTPLKFDRPGPVELRNMWNFYLRKFRICAVDDDALSQLVRETEHESGAFIRNFCQNYANSVGDVSRTGEEGSLLDRLRRPGYVYEPAGSRDVGATVFQILPHLKSAVSKDRRRRESRGEYLGKRT